MKHQPDGIEASITIKLWTTLKGMEKIATNPGEKNADVLSHVDANAIIQKT